MSGFTAGCPGMNSRAAGTLLWDFPPGRIGRADSRSTPLLAVVELSPMKTADNKAIVQRWFDEVWNQGREDTIDELHAPDGVSYGLGGSDTEVRGPGAFKVFFRNLRGAFPDTRVTFLETLADGNKVVVRFEVQGTHTGVAHSAYGARREVFGNFIYRSR